MAPMRTSSCAICRRASPNGSAFRSPGGPSEESGGKADDQRRRPLRGLSLRRQRYQGARPRRRHYDEHHRAGRRARPMGITSGRPSATMGSWSTSRATRQTSSPTMRTAYVDSFLYIAPPIADLSLTLQASSLQPSLNTDVTFTVTVTNGGRSDASGVAVRVPLPPGLTYVSRHRRWHLCRAAPASGPSARWPPARVRACRSSGISQRRRCWR